MAFRSRAEGLLFAPRGLFRHLLVFALFPFSLAYCLAALLSFFAKRPKIPPLPVVSIGNLTVGGSGKTPFTIALARNLEAPAIVLRGYGRKSRGTLVVARGGKLLADVETSGDEAALFARSLPGATVIVAENRWEGIEKAKGLGAGVVLLDDGFRHRNIRKLDILLVAADRPRYPFCLPAGAYRLPPSFRRFAAITAEEGREYTRTTAVSNPGKRMALVTAIARPERLEPYLPDDLAGKALFPDHHFFTNDELEEVRTRTGADRLLVTGKDAVKIDPERFPLSILELEVTISESLLEKVRSYVTGH